jgi:two-component system, LytTR family, sensor kinase
MQRGRYQKIISAFPKSGIRLHMLFWFCVIGGYVLVQPALPEKYGWKVFSLMLSAKYFLVISMVYINLYFLIPRFIFKKQNVLLYILTFLLNNLIFAILLYIVDDAICQSVSKPGDEIRSRSDKIYYFITQFVSNFWYLGSTTALKFTKQHFNQRMELSKIEISKLQTEVKYLIAQMNPHFLFNAINTIYVQIDRKNEDARETVTKFSEMLRYQLYDCNRDTVSLENEIGYLQNYVAIQRLRKSQRHQIEFSYPDNTSNVQIAPMLFIGFLENAFKYVSNDINSNNFVHIEMLLEANQLKFNVENSIQTITKPVDNKDNSGIGLNNIRRRLELQFKDRYQLDITDNDKTFTVNLLLHLA